MLSGMGASGWANFCPDPQDLRGGSLPPNWCEMDRPLTVVSYFGEILNNLAYVQYFERAEIQENSVICRYYPNVNIQKFGAISPRDPAKWERRNFQWTCKKGWEDCEFW